jgi:LmbE family N-acetylglucosaminyl deacetylase
MKFSNPRADVFVPDASLTPHGALARVTHLCVAAHQDDIEIMAYAGIADCFGRSDRAFGGVVMTNGAGSPRIGAYATYTDDQMQTVRREEQRRAAQIGRYAIQIQLAHASVDVKNRHHSGVASDLTQIFTSCRPEVVYLHNPADKHDSHVAVLLRCLEAIWTLPADQRPKRVLGCEVWRDLDWLPDSSRLPSTPVAIRSSPRSCCRYSIRRSAEESAMILPRSAGGPRTLPSTPLMTRTVWPASPGRWTLHPWSETQLSGSTTTLAT